MGKLIEMKSPFHKKINAHESIQFGTKKNKINRIKGETLFRNPERKAVDQTNMFIRVENQNFIKLALFSKKGEILRILDIAIS